MNDNNWKQEMHHLLEVFDRESIVSLRKIKQYFEASERPFDENFHQYFLKLLTFRFDASFKAVRFEQMDEDSIQIASNTNVLSNTDDSADYLNEPDKKNSMKVKIEKDDADDPIAVADVNNKNGEGQPMQVADDTIGGEVESNDNGIEVDVKREIKVENETGNEMVDLPMVVFDPNKEGNDNVGNESFNNQNQSLSSVQKFLKRDAANLCKCTVCGYTSRHKWHFRRHQQIHESNASKPFKCKVCKFASRYKQALAKHQQIHESNASKRFKCKVCKYASRQKCNLEKHQRIHDNVKPFKCERCDQAFRQMSSLNRHQKIHEQQKSMDIVPDSNDGLYKCAHCTRHFTKWCSFNSHLKKSHKNNQRLFNCAHCMRSFAQKNEKESHETRCRRHHYECYLCKNYVSRNFNGMQAHMRTHSGTKPFECAVCKISFRVKYSVERHMKSIHNRINPKKC